MKPLQAPFPWFGGKRRAADLVWERFGDVVDYIEPFFGSGAVLLNRPTKPKVEIVNDADGFIANFWRSVAFSPEETARWADWPINEADLHARNIYLTNLRQDFTAKIMGSPDYYDPKIAGWWAWGISTAIRPKEFCGINGCWNVDGEGRIAKTGKGVPRSMPCMDSLKGVNASMDIPSTFLALHHRLRRVLVLCGDWSRSFVATNTTCTRTIGIFLDPPYDGFESNYAHGDPISASVRKWAIANGDNPLFRIAVCGYVGEHEFPQDWECVAWAPNDSRKDRERIWFSPHCLRANQGVLL